MTIDYRGALILIARISDYEWVCSAKVSGQIYPVGEFATQLEGISAGVGFVNQQLVQCMGCAH